MKLIRLVTEEGFPVCRVAKRLELKLSTARNIIKKFLETGEVFMKTKKVTKKLDIHPIIKI